MREILFRGKQKNTGKWVYGYLVKAKCIFQHCNGLYTKIINGEVIDGEFYDNHYIVDPETVGQFTGLFDKNGTKIFEGDIIKTVEGLYPVVCESGGVWLYDKLLATDNLLVFLGSYKTAYIEVVGNIHDNPELLEDDE